MYNYYVMIVKQIKDLDSVDYYKLHLTIISPYLKYPLNPKEKEILAVFMSFEGELAKVDRIGTIYRKKVKEILNLSSGGLTNHLKSIKDKEFIYETLEGTLAISDYLFPDSIEQEYRFKIIQKKQDGKKD